MICLHPKLRGRGGEREREKEKEIIIYLILDSLRVSKENSTTTGNIFKKTSQKTQASA
jgi:hypothetical protein